jgi:hypothetical protein
MVSYFKELKTMEPDKKYNGWTNYETWVTALWLDNDFDLYTKLNTRAMQFYNEGSSEYDVDEAVKQATYKLSLEIKKLIEDNTPTTKGVYADLLNASISEIDWYEIAEHYTNEL